MNTLGIIFQKSLLVKKNQRGLSENIFKDLNKLTNQPETGNRKQNVNTQKMINWICHKEEKSEVYNMKNHFIAQKKLSVSAESTEEKLN